MKITKEDIERVALLARLELSLEEKQMFTEQLDKIFHHIAKLNQLDTENIEPLDHVVEIVNAYREDQVINQPSVDSLLANAPDREENYFKVPKIIE